jgi:sec-independent protein translocase protein TatA
MIEDLLQPRHLLVILILAILFFGPQKLPSLGKDLAQGIRNFKDSFKEASPATTVAAAQDGPPQNPVDL